MRNYAQNGSHSEAIGCSVQVCALNEPKVFPVFLFCELNSFQKCLNPPKLRQRVVFHCGRTDLLDAQWI